MTKWEPGSYFIATATGTVAIQGWTYRGLGLRLATQGEERQWVVSHLGSGTVVCFFPDYLGRDGFAEAAEIAEVGDWSFDGLDGWKNMDPDLFDRALPLISRIVGGGVFVQAQKSPELEQATRDVITARETRH